MSGLQVNWNKSHVCVLSGSCSTTQGRLKTTETIEVLGVQFQRNIMSQDNTQKVISKISQKLEFWKLRRLTLSGKVLVVKAVILPLLLYTNLIFPPNVRSIQKITRLLFVFFWGAKMERVSRVTVMKDVKLGGYNFPNVQNFIGIQLWISHFKTYSANGVAARFVRYLAGWTMLKWGWCVKDLRKPMALVPSFVYLRLHQFFLKNKLSELGVGAMSKANLVKWMRREEVVTNILGLKSISAEKCWGNFLTKGVTNRQKEISWMAFQGCLLTKSFLKARNLARDDRCPREGCGEVETAAHVFWECNFAKSVCKKEEKFVNGVVENMCFLGCFFGLVGGRVQQRRKAWIFFAILKEVLWDVRCWKWKKNVNVSEKDCMNLCLAKLYVVLLYDRKWMGVEDANLYWKYDRWRREFSGG